MADETFRISYTMERGDYVAMCRRLLKPSLRSRLIKAGTFLVLFLAILFVAGRGYEDFGTFIHVMATRDWWFYPALLLPALIIFYSHTIAWLVSYFSFRKMTSADRGASIVFSEANVDLESRTVQSKLKWDAFVRLIRTRDHVFMALAKGVALIVPRRSFTSDAEFDAFWRFACGRVAPGTPTK